MSTPRENVIAEIKQALQARFREERNQVPTHEFLRHLKLHGTAKGYRPGYRRFQVPRDAVISADLRRLAWIQFLDTYADPGRLSKLVDVLVDLYTPRDAAALRAQLRKLLAETK